MNRAALLGAALLCATSPGAPRPASIERAAGVRWSVASRGVETAEIALRVPGEAHVDALGRIRVVLVRVDPSRVTLALDRARTDAGGDDGAWRVDRAPSAATLALNAGQFTDDGPWGWVVHRGREYQAPGRGALAAALVVDTRGNVDVVDAAALDTARAAAARGEIAEAVQSYPALLERDGEIPLALRERGRGVDLDHRDARLAVCVIGDRRLLVALTRFDAPAFASVLTRVPLGLTVPESARLVRALGCRRAVLLDGGLSAQLLVRDARGDARTWPGLRAVPLGLVATPRE